MLCQSNVIAKKTSSDALKGTPKPLAPSPPWPPIDTSTISTSWHDVSFFCGICELVLAEVSDTCN